MWLVVIVSLVILVVVYYFFIKNKQYKVEGDDFSYKSKDFLLSKTERSVYETLCHYINHKKLRLKVFPKMRLTDFLWSPKDNRNAYLRISGKFVDFLIVDKIGLKPVVAIFIMNKDNRSKVLSLDIIEPALNNADIELIKIDSDIVFDERKIIDIIDSKLKEVCNNDNKE